MHANLFKNVIKNKDRLVSVLHDSKFEQTVNIAKTRWCSYKPNGMCSEVVGIDSSYNSAKYQGFEFWVATGTATNVSGSISSNLFKYGLERSRQSAGLLASQLEMDLCWEMAPCADLVLVDGSMHSKMIECDNTIGMFDSAKSDKVWNMLGKFEKNKNVVFVSKSSYTKAEFGNDRPVGDIYYYGKASYKAGFSRIFEDHRYGSNAVVSISFVRLADCAPLVKIELFGRGHTESEIKLLADRLSWNSICGYPYSLKLAHERCTVTRNDMEHLSKICGFHTEIGARQVLG